MYIIVLFLLSVVAILFMLVPYFRGRAVAQEIAPDVGVYKSQLTELENDLQRGIISENQAKISRTEIERRLLKAAGHEQAPLVVENPSTIMAISMLLVLLFSTGLYAMLGTPGMPDYPKSRADDAFAGSAEAEEAQKTRDLKAQLVAQMSKQPADPRGLAYLSRLEMELGNYQAASQALYQAYQLEPDNFDLQLMYAESLIVAAGERVTPAALVLLNKASQLEPDHPGPKYYLALGDFQAGEVELAHSEWTQISNSLDLDNPLKPLVDYWVGQAENELGIAQALPATRAPSITSEQAEIIQNMDEDQQQELIRQMVLQLAEKQQQNPGNIEGWIRLSRAYMVLGQKEDAIEAMKSAAVNAPETQKEILQKEVEKLTNLQ